MSKILHRKDAAFLDMTLCWAGIRNTKDGIRQRKANIRQRGVLHVLKVGETSYWTKFHVFFRSQKGQDLTSRSLSICNNLATINLVADNKNDKDYLKVRACIKSNTCDHFSFTVFEIDQNGHCYVAQENLEDGPGYQDIVTIYTVRNDQCSFGIKIQFVGQLSSRYKDLYEDEYTDYELCGGAGDAPGVRVHRCVIAASSSVLRNALPDGNGAPRMTLEYTTTETLQHFKEWIYKCELPADAGACARLVSLAGRLEVPALVVACTARLARLAARLGAGDLWDVLHAATERRDHHVLLALLEIMDLEKARQMKCQFRQAEEAARSEADQEAANAGATNT